MNIINLVNHSSCHHCTKLPVPAEEPPPALCPGGTSTGLQGRAGLHSPSSGSGFGSYRHGPSPSSNKSSPQRQNSTTALIPHGLYDSKAPFQWYGQHHGRPAPALEEAHAQTGQTHGEKVKTVPNPGVL